jgi:ribosomal protein S15P/S13E
MNVIGEITMIEKKWAANEEVPLTREQQIELMITAKERREDHLERWKNDPEISKMLRK